MKNLIIFCVLVHLVIAPPPRRNEVDDKKQDSSQDKDELDDFGLEYNRYLKEVIDLLESDPTFKKKLENAQEADIRSGQIAKELDFVDHKVRTKLDEVKRQELERLRHLAQKQFELTNGIDTEHMKISPEHLDHENPHTFEMEDLKKLIAKVSADLNEADQKRREEFKQYEMQKEYEKQQKLQHLEGSEKEAFEKQLKENETKHKQHEPLHHPGSKQQLEEVWEKQDHMENQEFDPKVFFQLHDLDGNGFWDQDEVKTLFLKELDKMYEPGAPEDDMKERIEEMERMREHVFEEADKNKDGLISYEEFIDKTKQPDFEKDPGWESLDQKPVFTHEEYLEFERKRQEEVQKMIQQGLIPPQPVFHSGPGYHPQQYVQYHPAQYPAQGYPGGQHLPQGQLQQRYAQGFPSQQQQHGYPQPIGGHPNQAYPHPPVQQQYQGQFNQPNQPQHGQGHPLPPQQANQNQFQQHPQGYQQSGQVHSNQPPQGYQQHPQGHPNQPSQAYQQPAQGGHPNQPSQAYQQQGHPSQPSQGYQQQVQGHPNQPSQAYHVQEHTNPPPSQGYQQPNHAQAPITNANSQNNPQPSYDANNVHSQQTDPKYSKDGGNSHPNVIDSQQKKGDQANEQSKFSNQ